MNIKWKVLRNMKNLRNPNLISKFSLIFVVFVLTMITLESVYSQENPGDAPDGQIGVEIDTAKTEIESQKTCESTNITTKIIEKWMVKAEQRGLFALEGGFELLPAEGKRSTIVEIREIAFRNVQKVTASISKAVEPYIKAAISAQLEIIKANNSLKNELFESIEKAKKARANAYIEAERRFKESVNQIYADTNSDESQIAQMKKQLLEQTAQTLFDTSLDLVDSVYDYELEGNVRVYEKLKYTSKDNPVLVTLSAILKGLNDSGFVGEVGGEEGGTIIVKKEEQSCSYFVTTTKTEERAEFNVSQTGNVTRRDQGEEGDFITLEKIEDKLVEGDTTYTEDAIQEEDSGDANTTSPSTRGGSKEDEEFDNL